MRSIRKLLPLVALLVAAITAYPVPTSLSTAVNSQRQSINLVLGNPSDATTDTDDKDNFLMVKPQFVLSFNNSKGGANWVAWHLQASDIGDVERGDFHVDTSLPEGFKRITKQDYTGSGYDRGHLCNSKDRTKNKKNNDATFNMTNILPQAADNNQGPWVKLENFGRTLAGQGNELYIYAGAVGTGCTGKKGFKNTIANGDVNVPKTFWKVMVILPRGNNDLIRITENTRAIAVCMAEQAGDQKCAVAEVRDDNPQCRSCNWLRSSQHTFHRYPTSNRDSNRLSGNRQRKSVPVTRLGIIEAIRRKQMQKGPCVSNMNEMEERSSSRATDNIQPVRFLNTDDRLAQPTPGVALCLSGGGYRAMLFHLGALWRLNEFGLLRSVVRISSVSGGSITAGVLGLHWKRLQFNENNVATNLGELVINPIRSLANDTIDRGSIIKGILLPRITIADEIARAYRKHLFGNATLQDLPSDNEGPRFVINATNVQDNVLWRFSKPFMGDYRVGLIRNPKLNLAIAVAASSAFPPFLSPAVLKLNPADFDPTTRGDLQFKPYTSEVVLTDGGVYDNLGLETAWKVYETILVSDGGGGSSDEPKPKREWLKHVYRVLNLLDTQVRSLRKRQIIGSYQMGLRKGTYWGIRTNIEDYKLPTAMHCPFDKTLLLANTPTRLKRLAGSLQERIINWGYAVCDAAIRTHLEPSLPKPVEFPYPGAEI